jgi:hypothetical protein
MAYMLSPNFATRWLHIERFTNVCVNDMYKICQPDMVQLGNCVANRSFATSSGKQMLRTARSQHLLGLRTARSQHLLENKCCEPLVRNIFWEVDVAIRSFTASSRRECCEPLIRVEPLGNKWSSKSPEIEVPHHHIFSVGISTSFFDYFPFFHVGVGVIQKGIHYIKIHSNGNEHIFQQSRR